MAKNKNMSKDYVSMSCLSQVSAKYMMIKGKRRGWLESIDLMGELCECVDGCEWGELVCSVDIASVKLGVVDCMGVCSCKCRMSMKNLEVIVRLSYAT